jgi:hypothetical protein
MKENEFCDNEKSSKYLLPEDKKQQPVNSTVTRVYMKKL